MDPRTALGNTAHFMAWLLPWSSALAVSGLISFTLVHALGPGIPAPPLRPAAVALAEASMLPPSPETAEGLRWVTIAAGQIGRAERCLIRSNAVSADIIEVYPEEIDRLLADLCIATDLRLK
jgi:hypothetical protein